MSDADKAEKMFLKEMEGRRYGREETDDARAWFTSGWEAAMANADPDRNLVSERPNCDTSFTCPKCGREDELDRETYHDGDSLEHTCGGCWSDLKIGVALTIRMYAEMANIDEG